MSSIEDFLKNLREKEGHLLDEAAQELMTSEGAPVPDQTPEQPENATDSAAAPETPPADLPTHRDSNGHICHCDGPDAHSCQRAPELEER